MLKICLPMRPYQLVMYLLTATVFEAHQASGLCEGSGPEGRDQGHVWEAVPVGPAGSSPPSSGPDLKVLRCRWAEDP